MSMVKINPRTGPVCLLESLYLKITCVSVVYYESLQFNFKFVSVFVQFSASTYLEFRHTLGAQESYREVTPALRLECYITGS